MSDRTIRRVVCAALLMDDTIVTGARHYDSTMHEQINKMEPRFKERFVEDKPVQGFIDQWGRFMNRRMAFEVATAAGQIIEKTGNPDSNELFSEDLY